MYFFFTWDWLSAEGQMRNIETDEPFKFEVKEGDRAYNQKHYEALGEVEPLIISLCFVTEQTIDLFCLKLVMKWFSNEYHKTKPK